MRYFLLCMMAFIAIGTLASSQPDIQSPTNAYDDVATKEMKQLIKDTENPDISNSKTWGVSSQAENRTFQNTSPNYPIKANSFLGGIMTNNSYVITASEFLEMSKTDPNWVVVDLRPPEKYAEGHIKNAINVPLTDLQPMMRTIFPDKELAVYGDNNTNSAYGVMALRIFGDRNAWLLSDGITAWEAAGMPVVT
ncbi:MAG: hypothetical protein LUQ38_12505 [Methanotrichaceae archaeon]|nr:hypothetical protein [Methanotrichaceae archaeon]MDD1757367.1 hypothetical protein [Methanotrichaceae archaeon]